MTGAVIWFLVQIGGGAYVGPIREDACRSAEAALIAAGERAIVCREAEYVTACPVMGMPGAYTTCPVFDFPHVTVKPAIDGAQ
jgi:hypothetical protein